MTKVYTVGRGAQVDIKIPKEHDTVGKLHLEIEPGEPGRARVTDLQSTNGTFVSVGRNWEEIRGTRVVSLDADLMLGEYRTTARKLLAAAPVAGKAEAKPPAKAPPIAQPKADEKPSPKVEAKSKSRKLKESPAGGVPSRKRSGPRRNEFGEIVNE